MSILKCYTIRCGGALSNPNGSLPTRISSASISSANDEVRSMQQVLVAAKKERNRMDILGKRELKSVSWL